MIDLDVKSAGRELGQFVCLGRVPVTARRMQVASLDPRSIRHRPLRLAFQLLDRLVQSADQRFLAEVVDLT